MMIASMGFILKCPEQWRSGSFVVSGVCISLPCAGCVWWVTWRWLPHPAFCMAYSPHHIHVHHESTYMHFYHWTSYSQHGVFVSSWLAALCKFVLFHSN